MKKKEGYQGNARARKEGIAASKYSQADTRVFAHLNKLDTKVAQWCSRVKSTAADVHQYFGDTAETMFALLVEAVEASRCGRPLR